jgi:hypothetical protein
LFFKCYCVRANKGLSKYPHLNSPNLWGIVFYGKRDCANVIKDLERRRLSWMTPVASV